MLRQVGFWALIVFLSVIVAVLLLFPLYFAWSLPPP